MGDLGAKAAAISASELKHRLEAMAARLQDHLNEQTWGWEAQGKSITNDCPFVFTDGATTDIPGRYDVKQWIELLQIAGSWIGVEPSVSVEPAREAAVWEIAMSKTEDINRLELLSFAGPVDFSQAFQKAVQLILLKFPKRGPSRWPWHDDWEMVGMHKIMDLSDENITL